MRKAPKYSWIIPVNNEAESLPQLFSEITEVMKGQSYEVVVVNDGSTDSSSKVLQQLSPTNPQIKVIQNSHQLGKWASLYLGFKECSGQLIITLDSDLQDHPLELPKLLQKVEKEGFDLASGSRIQRQDLFYKTLISNFGNWLVSKLYGYHFQDLNSPFKVYKAELIQVLPKVGSLWRFSLLFAREYNFKVVEVPISHRPRKYGKSKFGIVKYFRILYDLILMLLLFRGSGKIRNQQ